MNINLTRACEETLQYVDTNYATEYVIHVEVTNDDVQNNTLLIDHYLFGCVNWNMYRSEKWHKQNRFYPQASLNDLAAKLWKIEDSRIKIILLSNDLIYAFKFTLRDDIPLINVDLSSAVFGKGTFYNYLTLSLRGHKWWMYSQYERGKIYNRIRGTLHNCLDKLKDRESLLEHPYQYMIEKHPRLYNQATRKKRVFI